MKVILLQDVKGTGKKDQIVQVSDGYARNFLFPRKWAMEASDTAVREVERKRKAEAQREAEARAKAEALAHILKGKGINLTARCGEKGRLYGSVTSQEIADALKAQYQVDIDKRRVELAEPIRTVGDTQVTVWVYPGVTAKMVVHVTPSDEK